MSILTDAAVCIFCGLTLGLVAAIGYITEKDIRKGRK